MPRSIAVHLSGEIDLATVDELSQGLYAAADIEQPEVLVVDLTGVTFMDSSGLGMLAKVRKRQAAHDGQTLIRGASPMIYKTLQITGMDQVFPGADQPFQAAEPETDGTDAAAAV